MAGLLIRELKLRGLAERVLIICPANLTFQWQRELKDKFEEKFVVMKGDQIREQFGINQWLETPQIITSLDLAKRDTILNTPVLSECHHVRKQSAASRDCRGAARVESRRDDDRAFAACCRHRSRTGDRRRIARTTRRRS